MTARVLLAVLIVAACLAPPGRLFHATLLHPSEDPLPVTLGDQTGLVVGIQSAEVDTFSSWDLRASADPADPMAFVLTWLGGACDSDADVSFQRTGSGYALHLEVHRAFSLGCRAVGIPRALRIITAEPIPVGSIGVNGQD